MNLEEAKANIGKEVVLDESTKPYSNHTSILSSRCQDIKKGTILGIEENKSVLIDVYGGFHMFVYPRHIKLKEQPMQNYKIKVTPETSEEVQKLFFELGYEWMVGGGTAQHTNENYLITRGISINYTDNSVRFNECEYQEITLPQLRDLVVLHRNDVGDATHEHIRSGNKYYRGFEDYCFSGIEWILTDITFPNSLKPINREMTWQDALRYLENGEDVEFYNQTTKVWHNLLDSTIRSMRASNGKFRLKPKTIHIDGGEYTKEELLKIAGEME